jgi:Multicopper oxidase
MHCHIAFHAASGLAMQIIENKDLINATFQEDEEEIRRVCSNWDTWFSDPLNLWDLNQTIFQDDSGV